MTGMRAVIGQQRLLARLGERAARGELAHAYGLFGPRSIGKRTAAIRIAQTLCCTDPTRPAGGCGACRSCVLVERGSHPDVRIVERAADRRDISIEQVREAARDLALRPIEGRARVVIVDDAAELSEVAPDALLKTLEEPPPHAVLLLLTHAPEALPETIRSRLQPLQFHFVATAEIAAALRERGAADPDAIAAAAGGRPGLAIRLATDAGERAGRRGLERELLRLVSSGLTDRFAWAADLADEPDPRKRSESIDVRLDGWVELLRDAAIRARGLGDPPLRPDRATETAWIGATVGARELVDTALLVERLRRDLAWSANARMLLELLALRLPYVADLAVSA